jgi:hypothetical protein
MSQALIAKDNADYDEIEAGAWQAKQVSTISVMSFVGRLLIGNCQFTLNVHFCRTALLTDRWIGIVSDFVKQRLKLPRSFCCMLVAFLALCSQLVVISIEDVQHLWQASALLGLAYGCTFSLLPNVSIEWFGLGTS